MDDFKTIKKIVRLAEYDFRNNVASWLSITGFYAALVMISFAVVCFVLDSFDMAYWGWVSNFFFDWIIRIYSLMSGDAGFLGQLLAWYMVLFFILLPLGIIKNSLDLAFDSAMSGIIFTDLSYATLGRYIVGFAGGHAGVSACVLSMMIGVGYFLRPEYYASRFLFHGITYVLLCIAAYFIFLLYLFCMHLVEYKDGIRVSLQEFCTMVVGRQSLILLGLCVQALLILCGLVFLTYVFGLCLDIPVTCIIWFVEILGLTINPIFAYMLYNFFYVWAYLFLYACCSLVAAHVYRQLICPPVENVSCASCNSCVS